MSRESPGASKTHSLKSASSLTRWLRRAPWGEHSLLVYNTTDEFLKVLVTYLEAGLSQNQSCLWIVSAVPLEEAKEALRKEVGSLSPYIRKKQFLIVSHLDWYLAGGSFDEETILRELLKKEENALARGFAGLRVARDAAWAEKRDWPSLLQYEGRLSSALAGRKITALCAYPAESLSLGGMVDMANMHDILIAREGRALRLTRPIRASEGALNEAELQREHKQAEEELEKFKFMVESAYDAIFYKDLESRYIIVNDKTLEVFALPKEKVIGKNDYEIMPNKEEARKNIEDDQIVFKTGKSTEITKHMTGADGKEYWFEAIKVPQFDSNGNIIGLVGIARDITERKLAEEKIEQRTKELTALNAVVSSISGSLELKEVLKLITKRGAALLEGDGGTTALFTPEKDTLEIVAACGKQKSLLGKPLPLEGSLCGWVVRHGKPQIVENALQDPRFLKEYARKARVGNCIAAPLVLRDKVIGTIFVQNKKGESRGFTSNDLDLLVAFANQAAVAIDNARFYQEAEQSVEELRALSARLTNLQDEERARIVNYLHSNLAQTLTAAKTNLGLISRQPKRDLVKLRKSLTSVILMIDEAIKETRGLMFDLRTPMLDDLGLIAAVRWYARVLLKRTGVKVEIEVDGFPKDLSHTRRLMFFRIIQELLTNVAKHAKVSKAKLSVQRRDGMDVIAVTDRGVGFNTKSLKPSRGAATGLGLVAIRETVSRNRGHLDIDSIPRRGSTVTVRIPAEEPSVQD